MIPEYNASDFPQDERVFIAKDIKKEFRELKKIYLNLFAFDGQQKRLIVQKDIIQPLNDILAEIESSGASNSNKTNGKVE